MVASSLKVAKDIDSNIQGPSPHLEVVGSYNKFHLKKK